jgi:hypothetical protein
MMLGASLNTALLDQLYDILLESRYFKEHQALQTLFIDQRIHQWLDRLPEAVNARQRAELLIDYLLRQGSAQKNGLILFLCVLHDRLEEEDYLRIRLKEVIADLEVALAAVANPAEFLQPLAQLQAQLPLPDTRLNLSSEAKAHLHRLFREVTTLCNQVRQEVPVNHRLQQVLGSGCDNVTAAVKQAERTLRGIGSISTMGALHGARQQMQKDLARLHVALNQLESFLQQVSGSEL